MKQYILALRSLDFIKSGKSWSTGSIDLYNNKFYTNYSIARSRFGIDELGDRTFVGTEIIYDATPSITVLGETAGVVTNYGEIVKQAGIISYNVFDYDETSGQYVIFTLQDGATPYYVLQGAQTAEVFRFVDTSSQIDIISYKGAFTNINAKDAPSFTIKVYEGDTSEGPWMLSSISSDVGTLFISDAKRYSRFEVEVESELEPSDVENFGFVLLVQVSIAHPIPPVLSKSAKNILARFPSWMKMYEDAMDQATPELYVPQTVAGKFVNALVADYPENFEKQKDLFGLDKAISTADTSQLAWIYSTTDVPPSHLHAMGEDNIGLSKLTSIEELYEAREEDLCYFYSPADREMFTVKLFQYLTVDGVIYEQNPILRWNWFDEFGTRVGLSRLYLESNANFKLRILDVYKNLPGVSSDSFKLTLRRELDIWSAYGATPDSNYLGATPEVLEIQDIENSTPYFSFDGNPQPEFKNFVRDLNEKYPVNWGYVKWNDGFWDYAGENQTGVGRIKASYDDSASPFGNYYQAGVGDNNDALIMVKEPIESNVDFSSKFKAYGIRKTGVEDVYSPIAVNYEYYGSYYQTVYENTSATANFDYALILPPHASHATPSVYHATVNTFPTNSYSPTHSSSPEYSTFKIFDAEGNSIDGINFYNRVTGTLYQNTSATPTTNKVNFYYATELSATPMSGSANSHIKFADATPITSTIGSPVKITKPYFTTTSADIKVVSNQYDAVRRRFYTTPKIPGSLEINASNNTSQTKDFTLDKNFIQNSIVFPPGSTPEYVHIDNATPFGYVSIDGIYESDTFRGFGGVAYDPTLGFDQVIPSSPNIIASYLSPNFATPTLHPGYRDTTGSTANYYFTSLLYPYGSTPTSIVFSSADSANYPFTADILTEFTAHSTPMIDGTVNEFGVVRTDPDNKDENFTQNSNLIGRYDLNYSSFGIDKVNYTIKKIEVVNDVDGVELSLSKEFVYRHTDENIYFANSIIEDQSDMNSAIIAGVEVSAQYKANYDSYIHTGWYSQNEEDHYIYSDPVDEAHVTPGFSLSLETVALQGAPIIVQRNIATPGSINLSSATPEILREVSFPDQATPTELSLVNYETIYANASNNIYLGYEDVYDVTVVDAITGYTVLSNGQTKTNEIEVFSSATPVVKGREYGVTYKVRNSYLIDNDYYDSSSEKYISRMQFDSTPSTIYSYDVTYESNYINQSTPISLTVNPLQLWDQEGFVYLSHNDYNFNTAIISLKPEYVIDDGDDYTTITIQSVDINGNSKPYQTFSITGPYIIVDSQYITTDINGFAYTNIRYNGVMPSATPGSYITVSGVANGSTYAHENSQTQGYVTVLNFEIITEYSMQNSIKAIADTASLRADGLGEQYIRGVITSGATPVSNNVIYWRKGRTLYDIFTNNNYSNYVRSDSNGNFTIGPIQAASSLEPGYWMMAVESEHSATQSSTPTTVSGDVVYWSEKYDNLNYHSGGAVLYNPNVLLGRGVKMSSTPNFTLNYHDGSDATVYAATPNWLPPKWYPLDRAEQYQMGLLGSTPNVVSSYDKLMNDYEEE
jgi:hypothetical protein